jgi:hypothetical protein
VGFVLSLGWSKVAGGGLDRDKTMLLAKVWGGMVLAGFVNGVYRLMSVGGSLLCGDNLAIAHK